MFSHDVIVVGGGAAGLRAAIECSKECDTALISANHPIHSNTVLACGGVNAALGNNRRVGLDSPERHLKDTVARGAGLSNEKAAAIMCEEAPRRVIELEHWGLPFDRMRNGLIAQRSLSPGLFPRACTAGEEIGHRIVHTLFQQTLRWGIKIYESCRVVRIIVQDGECHGVIALDIRTGELLAFKARAVILATGGLGWIFPASTNCNGSNGSGVALAYLAGAKLRNLEFIEFHPLTLHRRGLFLPLSLLQMGGHLVNFRGERFMELYSSEEMEKAETDVLLRAIQKEIDDTPDEHPPAVRLQLQPLGQRKILGELQVLRERLLLTAGLDIASQDILVSPAEHFTIGGVAVDENGATSISRLYAAGECACTGAHGARTLPGNPLAEALVFGRRAGEAACSNRTRTSSTELIKTALEQERDRISSLLSRNGSESPSRVLREIASCLFKGAGILRKEEPMNEALERLDHLHDMTAKLRVRGDSAKFNIDLLEAITIEEALALSKAVVAACLAREESRGAHFRLDFGRPDDYNWGRNSIVELEDTRPRVEREAIGHESSGGAS